MAANDVALPVAGGPALLVERVPIDSLRTNPKNARTHSSRQIRQLAANIRKFGFTTPVMVDAGRTILAGHGRIEAARLAGLAEIPVIRLGHLTPAQCRAYLIADNRIAEQAGWNRELLALELGELVELLPTEGMDISLTGFEIAEVDLLLGDMADGPTAPEDVVPQIPEPGMATTRRGDLWQLGKHRLLCGDAQLARDFARLMNGAAAAAVVTDPPYNVRVKNIGGRGRTRHREFAFASGEMSQNEFRAFLKRTLGNAVRVSADGAVHYTFMDWRHIGDLIEVGRGVYGEMLNLVVWNKSNAGMGSLYRSQHELIGVFRVGDATHRNNIELGRFGRNRSNIWAYGGISGFGRDRDEALATHPTVKPVALVADALLDCTARGDAVLDPFGGSGTLVLAAEKVGRVAYTMEYEPGYVDAAILRWQRQTRRDAILIGDGRTFEDVAVVRRAADAPPPPAGGVASRRRRAPNRER